MPDVTALRCRGTPSFDLRSYVDGGSLRICSDFCPIPAGGAWHFSFNVKFYPPDPAQLSEDITRYLKVGCGNSRHAGRAMPVLGVLRKSMHASVVA